MELALHKVEEELAPPGTHTADTCLKVTNLAKTVKQEELDTLFWSFGDLLDCKLIGRTCHVEYGEQEHAHLAVASLKGRVYLGNSLEISAGQPRKKKRLPMIENKRLPTAPPGHSKDNLYINNLDDGVTETELSSLFEQHGKVTTCRIFIGKYTNTPLGTACVRMGSAEAASACVDAFDGFDIRGKKMSVSWALDKSRLAKRELEGEDNPAKRMKYDPASTSNLFFKNLPRTITQKTLENLCSKYGTVEEARLFIGQSTKEFLGTACVRMQSREEAQEVIDALHGSEMGGNRVVVEFALNKSKNRVRIPRRPFEDVAWTGRQRLEAFTRGPYTYNPYEPPPHFVEQAYPKRLLTPRRSPSQSPYGAPARRTAFNYGSATY